MKNHRAAAIVALMIAAAWLVPGSESFAATKRRSPVFEHEGYRLRFVTLETTSKVVFEGDGESEFELTAEGAVRVPSEDDIVAIRLQLKVDAVTDFDGRSMIPKHAKARKIKHDYSAVLDGEAKFEIDQPELTGNPYEIESMNLSTNAVLALERHEETFPARVMDDEVKILGTTLRIESIKSGKNRELEIEIAYTRPREGLRSPFIEAIYAYDSEGSLLGGGRWDEDEGGFGTRGKWKAKFYVPKGSRHDKFKVVFVTKAESVPLEFEAFEVFQN